jgi:hypothetical protein
VRPTSKDLHVADLPQVVSEAQILIFLYFVRYLTFNGFSVLCRRNISAKPVSSERELPSNVLGGVRLPSAVENSVRELGKPNG